MNFCANCGAKIEEETKHCFECGSKLDYGFSSEPNIVRNPSDSNANNLNIGIIGFVLAITSLILPIPIMDTIVGLVALILSILGLKEKKNGLAIAGLVIARLAIVGSIVLFVTDGYDFF